ncbi:MFS transporter [Arsenicicoccus bolidensis]|uniref:MFS transporter n=1 Tax=Arsenicicoccus bolidensis TaxID=229480 RepID=UPI00040EFC23|nr:MFS transporter [Arsenicicoccus bolidensis]
MTSESLWRGPDFVRYWASRAVSMLGSAITYVALPVLVYRLTGSATWTGVVTAMDTLPFVFFGLLGGALGDRLDRRALMVGADVVAALAIGSIVVAHLLGHLSIAHLLVAAFVSASAATIFDGANWGALPTLVGRARLPEANAKVYGTVSVFDAAGPAVVGLLLAVVEPGTLLIVDAASFAASALLIRGISRALSPSRPGGRVGARQLGRDVGEGLAYLARHPLLRPMTIVAIFGSAGAASILAVTVVWCDRVLGIGTSGWRFGLLYAAWGLGALLSSLVLARAMSALGAIRLTRRLLPVVTLLALVLASVDRFALAVPILLSYVGIHTLQYTSVVTWRQQVIPDELLSRVSSAARLIGWGAAASVGALVAGPVAQHWGVRTAILLAASLHACGAALTWVPALRRAEPASSATPA